MGNQCVYPEILFKFEQIDYDVNSEYLNIYNNDNSLIAKCGSVFLRYRKCYEIKRKLKTQLHRATTEKHNLII